MSENNFQALNAKISGIVSTFLKDEDLFELCRRDNLKDVIQYLKDEKRVGKGFDTYEDIYECNIKLSEYKRHLLLSLNKFLVGDYKALGDVMLSEFDAKDIKMILGSLSKKESFNKIKPSLTRIEEKLSIDLDTANSVQEFIELLKHTPYYRILKQYESEERHIMLFYMEMNIDKLYFSQIIKISEGFSKVNKEIVNQIFGTRIDLLNLMWIYRGKKYYDLLPEELINFCILGGRVYSYSKLKELCYLNSYEELISAVSESEYAFIFEGENIDIYMDRRNYRYLYYLSKKLYKNNNNDFGKYCSFIYLLDTEVKDLNTVMESTRFKLSYGDKLKYLVRKLEDVGANDRKN